MIRESEAKVLPLIALPMYLPTYLPIDLHVLIPNTVTQCCVEVDYFRIFIFDVIFDVNGVIFSYVLSALHPNNPFLIFIISSRSA